MNKIIHFYWRSNAWRVAGHFKGSVNWKGKSYICPFCGQLIRECDWTATDFAKYLCPICKKNY